MKKNYKNHRISRIFEKKIKFIHLFIYTLYKDESAYKKAVANRNEMNKIMENAQMKVVQEAHRD